MYRKYFDDEEGLTTYKYVFQEDDNTFWELTQVNDSRNMTLGGIDNLGKYCFITIKIIKYVLDDKKEKHIVLEVCKKFNLIKTNVSLSITFDGNENPDYYYKKYVDENDVTKYSFKFLINGEYKKISTTSLEKDLPKSVKNKIQHMIKYHIKNKWSIKNDPIVICQTNVDVHGYKVNYMFYETLKEAALDFNVSTSFLYKILNKKIYSSDFKVYRDVTSEQRYEKYRLSDVIFSMYNILIEETVELMAQKSIEKFLSI